MTRETRRFWRNAPGFSQRFTGTFSGDGNTITGRGRLSRDGTTWDDDLALTYRNQVAAIPIRAGESAVCHITAARGALRVWTSRAPRQP